jgi:hypothetical protein
MGLHFNEYHWHIFQGVVVKGAAVLQADGL